jgi:VIT1/CCC1 family predicted Fe2+/Mn2+ transporter
MAHLPHGCSVCLRRHRGASLALSFGVTSADLPPRTPGRPRGRPLQGFAHYLRDLVYGALDGVITTMAVVAGATGAQLGGRVALILGVANLLGDGVSMGASNYLGLKSELEQSGGDVQVEAPWRHGLATIGAFGIAGVVPLLAYVLPRPGNVSVFQLAATLSLLVLAATGAARAPFVGKAAWRSGGEMMAVGVLAGSAAYLVGVLGARLIR